MTKAYELQKWLREVGPRTRKEIEEAGFRNFTGKTFDRMLAVGAIVGVRTYNPRSEVRYARTITTLYGAGDIDYLPVRGRRTGSSGATPEGLENMRVTKAIQLLERRGYKVTPP
jgi:hypothetical protein